MRSAGLRRGEKPGHAHADCFRQLCRRLYRQRLDHGPPHCCRRGCGRQKPAHRRQYRLVDSDSRHSRQRRRLERGQTRRERSALGRNPLLIPANRLRRFSPRCDGLPDGYRGFAHRHRHGQTAYRLGRCGRRRPNNYRTDHLYLWQRAVIPVFRPAASGCFPGRSRTLLRHVPPRRTAGRRDDGKRPASGNPAATGVEQSRQRLRRGPVRRMARRFRAASYLFLLGRRNGQGRRRRPGGQRKGRPGALV